MGAVQLPDELQRVIEQQVVEGRASSLAAFLEEAIMRLVEETRAEEEEVLAVIEAGTADVEAGTADVEAGRHTTISTQEDARLLHERMMARMHARLTTEE